MADVKFQISPVPSVSDYLIAVLYKTTAPLEEIDRIVKAAPHDDPYSFNFTELLPGEYIVNIHISEDGEALGSILIDFWAKAINVNGLYQIFQFKVGDPDQPEDGADEYINATLAGYEIDWVHGGNGTSFWFKDVDWEATATGFRLINGWTFSDQQKVTFQISYTTETDSGPSLAPAFTEIITKAADTTLLAGEANKWIRFLSLLNNKADCNLPDPSALANGDGYLIECTRSSIKSVKIIGNINYYGEEFTHFYIGPGEIIKLIVHEGAYILNPADSRGTWDEVGMRGFSVRPVAQLDAHNMLLADRSTHSGLLYRRVYEYILSLPVGQRLSFGDAGETTTRRGLWSVNTVTQQFKTPDGRGLFLMGLQNIGFADPKRADNFPGGFRPWEVGPHDHPLPADTSGSGNMQSIVGSANNDETIDEDERTGENNPGGTNLPDNLGVYPIVYI